MFRSMLVCLAVGFVLPAVAADNEIVNGSFEQGLEGWNPVWARSGDIRAELDTASPHGGRQAVRIVHTGAEDWSLAQARRVPVKPGDIYEMSGWVRLEGEGNATLCVVLYGAENKVLDWSYGGRTASVSDGWRELRTRFVIPPEVVEIWPRLIGNGPATVALDEVALVRGASLAELRGKDLPPNVTATSQRVELTFRTSDGTFTLTDRATGRRWTQHPQLSLVVLGAREVDGGLDVRLLEPASMAEIGVALRLDAERPEVVLELTGEGELDHAIAYPASFATEEGDWLILPVNEGIGYPVDDASLPPMSYHLFGGHGLAMAWYGATNGQTGLMTLVETPDDAAVRIPRINGRLCLVPEWLPQRQAFGPARRLRYVLVDDGGYVAMAKRYRRYAGEIGLLKTLEAKRKENPDVDLLVGAVNVWCWDGDPVKWCQELQEAGIRRILWSNRAAPEPIAAMNALGVLTSRYDIYQDAMNPANFPNIGGLHADWTSDAWPDGMVHNLQGDWERGWQVKGKDGKMYPCGVLCDLLAPDYARRRIGEELKTCPYRARFIDTTTASPWRECYNPKHPMTRTQSRKAKMELLDVVSREFHLVTGSETGHDASVPYLHFFEGMMSLGPYRVPDAGRNMMQILEEVPERVAKFQTGHFYRLPLWELVYHDCTVSYWYWGDYNNKLPSLWDRRDLWNALYGTPPMFMFNRAVWNANRDRFVASYRTATPVARATGYREMLTHRWLTDDHAVQQTEFAGGVRVTVNFGELPYAMPDGSMLEPMDKRWEGLEEN